MRRAVALAAVLWLLPLAAPAAELHGCLQFAWSLDTELGWARARDPQAVTSGATLPAPPQKAIALALRPSAQAALPVPPSGKPHGAEGETSAGYVTFSQPLEAGLWQVSLSGPGWIDVIQGGKALPAEAHTSSKECDVLKKSLRFRLAHGPATVEISAVSGASIKLAIRRAD